MTWTGCEETTWWLTWALRQDETRERLAAMLDSNPSTEAIIDQIVFGLDDRVALVARDELRHLPGPSVAAIIEGWKLALRVGKPFEVASVRPTSPIEMARRRTVRVVVDISEDGVRAELSHIPARHPTWQLSAIDLESTAPAG